MLQQHRRLRAALVVAILALPTFVAADVILRDGSTTQQVVIATSGALSTFNGLSNKATYVVSVSALADTSAANVLDIEAGASKAVYIRQVCVGVGTQTTGGVRLFQLIRTSAAGSGTAIVVDSTSGASSITKFDPGDGAFTGIARTTSGTAGTAGIIVDQFALSVPTVGSTTISNQVDYVCKDYDAFGKKPIKVAAGITNGIKLTDAGATGGAGLSASIIFTEE